MTNTYGNRGMSFESLIEYANRQYRQDGIAVIEKQHTANRFATVQDAS